MGERQGHEWLNYVRGALTLVTGTSGLIHMALEPDARAEITVVGPAGTAATEGVLRISGSAWEAARGGTESGPAVEAAFHVAGAKVALIKPANGSWVKGTVGMNATSSRSTESFFIADQVSTLVEGSGTSLLGNWNTSQSTNGRHTLTATADGTSASSVVTVDNFVPRPSTLTATSFRVKRPGSRIAAKIPEFAKFNVKATLVVRKGSKVVKTLWSRKSVTAKPGGQAYAITWNGRDQRGRVVSAGNYTVELRVTIPLATSAFARRRWPCGSSRHSGSMTRLRSGRA